MTSADTASFLKTITIMSGADLENANLNPFQFLLNHINFRLYNRIIVSGDAALN